MYMFEYKSFSGESESDHHLVYCSKFLLASLCHLLMCLEKLDFRYFATLDQYQQALNYTNALVRKTEMVFSSHLAYWSVLQLPVRQKYLQSYLCYYTELVRHACVFSVHLFPTQPTSCEEAKEEGNDHPGLLAAMVVCVCRLVPVAVHQRHFNFLHLVVRLSVRQGEVHQVGHVSGPLPFRKYLYSAASKGG